MAGSVKAEVVEPSVGWLDRQSIKNKLMFMTMAVSSIVLVLFGCAMYTVNWLSTRDRLVSDLFITSEVIASNSSGALAFRDSMDARAVLGSLRSRDSIEFAALYLADGSVLTTYKRDSDILAVAPETTQGTEGWVFQDDLLLLWSPVVIDEKVIGGVYLQSDLSELNEALTENLLISVALLFIAALSAYVLSTRLRRIISAPILVLTHCVGRIANGDLSARADIQSQDEMGRLAKGFNEMTEQLQGSVARLEETLARTEEALIGQRTAQVEAEKSKSELEDVFESLPDIYLRLELSGVITDFRYKNIDDLEVSAERLMGRKIQDVLPADVGAVFEKRITEQVDSSQMQQWEFEMPVGENEGVRVFEARLTKSIRSDALILISRDITNEKHVEKALRRSQKMDALGHLTGGIAHDYNNMLGVILGYSELLQLELHDQPKAKEYADAIFHAGERSAGLTKTLLSFSRSTASSKEPIDINAQLLSQQKMLERTLTARIKLNFKLGDNLYLAELDSGELEDAIINMSINAQHAMSEGGQLTFTTRNISVNDTEGKYLELSSGEYVLLTISDTGTGMSNDVKLNIFDPFFSTKPADKGTGLGLSQVYGFVKRSGGHIDVYSELGVGTSFSLYFPMALASDKTVVEEPELPSLQAGESDGTILVVDDEPALSNLTTEILRGAGYQVIATIDSTEALEILQRETIALLVSDVIMPKLNGYELAEKAQALQPAIKIQLCSGFGVTELKGVDDQLVENLLSKPFSAVALLQRAKDLLAT